MTLEQAIRAKFVGTVECLVERGADVDAIDSKGDPVLAGAIRGSATEIVRILVVDGDANVDAIDSEGDPMLRLAIRGRFYWNCEDFCC